MLIRSPGNLVTTVPEHNGGVTNGDGVAVDEGGPHPYVHPQRRCRWWSLGQWRPYVLRLGEFPGDDGKPRNRQR